MKRREFIGIAAVGAAGVVLPSTSVADGSLARALSRPRLLEILRDDRLVADLGRSYREANATEGDAIVITAAILQDMHLAPNAPLFAGPDEWASRERLDELVHDDFSTGRTVILRGWILSLTEARQCALFSLRSA